MYISLAIIVLLIAIILILSHSYRAKERALIKSHANYEKFCKSLSDVNRLVVTNMYRSTQYSNYQCNGFFISLCDDTLIFTTDIKPVNHDKEDFLFLKLELLTGKCFKISRIIL